jgi:hypothetical protein
MQNLFVSCTYCQNGVLIVPVCYVASFLPISIGDSHVMELEEIHSLAVSPAVATSFASMWSDDDKISVITEKGLYVMVSNHISFNMTGFLYFVLCQVYQLEHSI